MRTKKLLLFTTLVASFIISSSFSPLKKRVEYFYLPKNFKGNVAIIYKNEGNVPNNVQSWNIPDNGILETDYKFELASITRYYLQKNSSGTYDTLQYGSKSGKTLKNKVSCLRNLSFAGSGDKRNLEYYVTSFYVGKSVLNETDKNLFYFERKIWKKLFNIE